MTILTVTLNPTIDKSARVDHVRPEHKLRCHDVRYDPGGGGVNVSHAIHNLHGHADAAYLAGGLMGKRLQQLVSGLGIEQHVLEISGETRENLILYEESSGQQYRIGMPGPRVREEEWTHCLKWLADLDPAPQWLVASGSLPPGIPDDFYLRLARQARKNGSRFVLDTSGNALRLSMAKEDIYLLKVNLRELDDIGKGSVRDDDNLEETAHSIIREGHCRHLIVSLGSGGALAVDKDSAHRITAPTVRIRSKIGAGDSMVGGMVLAMHRGQSFAQAARYGVAAGAAAVMSEGTKLCQADDVERIYKQMD